MKRALLTTCLALFAALASPAAAQDAGQRVQDAIIAQLGAQGFTHVRISNTLLGRVRIYATGPGTSREIIVNPRTGEILRDYWDDDDELEDGLVSPSTSRGFSSGRSDTGTSGVDSSDDGDDDRGVTDDDDGASTDSDDDRSDDSEDDGSDDKDDGDDKSDDENDDEDSDDGDSDDGEDDDEEDD